MAKLDINSYLGDDKLIDLINSSASGSNLKQLLYKIYNVRFIIGDNQQSEEYCDVVLADNTLTANSFSGIGIGDAALLIGDSMTFSGVSANVAELNGALLNSMTLSSDQQIPDNFTLRNINFNTSQSYDIEPIDIAYIYNCKNISIHNVRSSPSIEIAGSSVKNLYCYGNGSWNVSDSSITACTLSTEASSGFGSGSYSFTNSTISTINSTVSGPSSVSFQFNGCNISNINITNQGNTGVLLEFNDCTIRSSFVINDNGGTDSSYICNSKILTNIILNRTNNFKIYNNMIEGNLTFDTSSTYNNIVISHNMINGNFASSSSSNPPSIPSGVIAPYNIADNITDNYFLEPAT